MDPVVLTTIKREAAEHVEFGHRVTEARREILQVPKSERRLAFDGRPATQADLHCRIGSEHEPAKSSTIRFVFRSESDSARREAAPSNVTADASVSL